MKWDTSEHAWLPERGPHRRPRKATLRRIEATANGKSAMTQGDYQTAARHFRETDALAPSPKLRLTILLLETCPSLLRSLVWLRAQLLPAYRNRNV